MWHSVLPCGLSQLLLAGLLLLSPQTASCSDTITTNQLLQRDSNTHEYDVIIYGNTVAALAAAIKVKRMGKTSAIVSPRNTLGGMTASGLGWTDAKDGNAVGGIAREFYEKVFRRYQSDSLWKQEQRSTYMGKFIQAQPGPAIDPRQNVQWTFEPKVAEAIFEDWVKAGKLVVFRGKAIKRTKDGVTKNGSTITSMVTEDGTVFKGKMFIDAGYEGDLMDVAGIPWTIGRESEAQFGESTAGFRIEGEDSLPVPIDPYRKKGDPKSGFIYGIERAIANPHAMKGQADPLRLQAYNYRLCLTKDGSNKVPFTKPAGYNETNYEILFRYIETGYRGMFFTTSPMPNIKTDTNALGQVSTDLLGGCYNSKSSYPEWSYADRDAAAGAHKSWTQGLLYTLANHERVPQSIREQVSVWGYAKDEFVSNGNFPYELYIREGRRMKGVYTMKQSDITNPKTYTKGGVVALGSYTFDVHRVERVVVDNRTYNEGLVHVPNRAPFPIPFTAIIPEAKYATNFLNPVTMSSTHIGFSAIRMEPTYMMLGESAGEAAVLAIQKGAKVQDVDQTQITQNNKKVAESKAAGNDQEDFASSMQPSRLAGACFFLLSILAIIA